MKTRSHTIPVLTLSVVISIVICVVTIKNKTQHGFKTRVFKVVNGWGYDILVNNTIIIHQESIPVLQKKTIFSKKEYAEKTAALVIQKLEKGQPPTLTRSDLEKIIPVHEFPTSK